MRITATSPEARNYRLIWHVPKCMALKSVSWVDDETCEYGEFVWPIRLSKEGIAEEIVFKVKKIELIPMQGLILIDPIEGVGEEDLTEELALES